MAQTYIGYASTAPHADLDAAAAAIAAGAGSVTALTATVATNAATAAAATATVAASVAAIPPVSKFGLVATSGPYVAAAGELTGAQHVAAQYSGISGSTLTTRTAAQMIADAALVVGQTYRLRVVNTAGGTCTLTAGSGVTVTGHAAILTDTWVEYHVVVTGASAMTLQSIGAGDAP